MSCYSCEYYDDYDELCTFPGGGADRPEEGCGYYTPLEKDDEDELP